MNWRPRQSLKRAARLLAAPAPEPVRQQRRILTLQRDVVFPAKLVIIAVVFYSLYYSEWVGAVATAYGVILETMRDFFSVYILLNLLVGVSIYVIRRWPAGFVQWVVFTVGLLDGVFLGGLTLLTGGFASVLYWVFPAAIVINALCIPLAMPQIVLNLLLSVCFLGAGLLEEAYQEASEYRLYLPPPRSARQRIAPVAPDELAGARAAVNRMRRQEDPVLRVVWQRLPEESRQRLAELAEDPQQTVELKEALAMELNRLWPPNRVMIVNALPPEIENPAEPFLLRLVILWLLTVCCYGVQVLAVRQELAELAEAERKEFAVRTEQLHSAGRLAAEFSHQIKNPLAIINNAAFSLQRIARIGKGDPVLQAQIIQEEVAKADRIITQVMGYAQLSEGRVEKLALVEELDRALDQVFPPGAQFGTAVRREYAEYFPPLLMQRAHLTEIFVNLLQNARDALDGRGHVTVTARCRKDLATEVVIADDGPGIAPDKVERVFEAYYTTRAKGTGLGLAIVKHNVELYGGTVRLESGLGIGARFTVVFPATAAINLAKQA